MHTICFAFCLRFLCFIPCYGCFSARSRAAKLFLLQRPASSRVNGFSQIILKAGKALEASAFLPFQQHILRSHSCNIGCCRFFFICGIWLRPNTFHRFGFWFACMMLSLMLPFQIVMIPQFLLFNSFGWIGTYLPLIVPFWFGQPFFIFLDVQFIRVAYRLGRICSH